MGNRKRVNKMSLYNDKLAYAKQTGQWDEIRDEFGEVIAEVPLGRFRYSKRTERTLVEF